MKRLISHSNFSYANLRDETIQFQVQAIYKSEIDSGIELLSYQEFKGITIDHIDNENINNPIYFNDRLNNILTKYQLDPNWEDNLKYNCHYYSFFQDTDYWLDDIDGFLRVSEAKFVISEYSLEEVFVESDIILFIDKDDKIIHSCRFENNQFIHKCGTRGLHHFNSLEDWRNCEECKYDETKNYKVCRLNLKYKK
ncbi:hypothetical protein SAMN06265371_10627 [Lutibacter agarilyticus]|uniref:Uncharacterized protein n=1 Tax=Lutibacter agarilyticus TaxID=1109740 RepID=A0A238XJ98_9FLAO|nr:hypothetical protein [Lutibacter agarilyticus]SNR58029.1 hypothetical protein SAMN06265371_10627 [Lutibacter agarilyticus]